MAERAGADSCASCPHGSPIPGTLESARLPMWLQEKVHTDQTSGPTQEPDLMQPCFQTCPLPAYHCWACVGLGSTFFSSLTCNTGTFPPPSSGQPFTRAHAVHAALTFLMLLVLT